MTTSALDAAAPHEEGRPGPSTSWTNLATEFARQMAQESFRRGDLAELRRMHPDSTDSPVFLGLLAQEELLGSPEVERRWALILHGIALMTPRGGEAESKRTAHDGQTPVGKALYLGDETSRSQGFYSETRLKRLLTSRGGMTRTLLARAFRMLATKNVAFDWREMADFILKDGFNEKVAERSRYKIAREYFRAQRRSQPAATENE